MRTVRKQIITIFSFHLHFLFFLRAEEEEQKKNGRVQGGVICTLSTVFIHAWFHFVVVSRIQAICQRAPRSSVTLRLIVTRVHNLSFILPRFPGTVRMRAHRGEGTYTAGIELFASSGAVAEKAGDLITDHIPTYTRPFVLPGTILLLLPRDDEILLPEHVRVVPIPVWWARWYQGEQRAVCMWGCDL
jgi:hypothetical protein